MPTNLAQRPLSVDCSVCERRGWWDPATRVITHPWGVCQLPPAPKPVITPTHPAHAHKCRCGVPVQAAS